MTTARFLLVRHGQSTWNAVRRWQGRADPPLSELGEQQAVQSAASAVLLGPFSEVVTSTLVRARRTGELLAARLGVELGEAHDALSERSAGEWEGLTRVEIEERDPGFLATGRRPSGYEPDDDVIARATDALLTIPRPAQTPQVRSGKVLVVTHGGVINALERHAEEEWRRLDNLEGRWFDVDTVAGRVVPVGDRVRLLGVPDESDGGTGRGYA